MWIKGTSGKGSKENKNMPLEPGEKAILSVQQQKTWLNFVLCFWRRRICKQGSKYLAEDISKQIIEGVACKILSG